MCILWYSILYLYTRLVCVVYVVGDQECVCVCVFGMHMPVHVMKTFCIVISTDCMLMMQFDIMSQKLSAH